jgi:glutamyl-tRNA synthetase
MKAPTSSGYCGRLAPTPSGGLHLGHARTFREAWRRARAASGRLILRIEDLDQPRCRPEYVKEALEELAWLGLDWDGDPVFQSQRRTVYLEAWEYLKSGGWIYPCGKSRKDLQKAQPAPPSDEQDAEPLYPVEWRPAPGAEKAFDRPGGDVTWRFRVPEGEVLEFEDVRKGRVRYTAGVDFGDFSVWRRDDVPSYELSVVVDDIAMGITEVVRGEDLLRSTARQLLLYRALKADPPSWCHEPLVRDARGRRLAKRDHDRSLQSYRQEGLTAEEVFRRLDAGR